MVVKDLCAKKGFILINCNLFVSEHDLYRSICGEKSDVIDTIHHLQTLSPTYIVFDNVEVIYHRHPQLISLLLRFHELSLGNIGCIFVSNIEWHRYMVWAEGISPVQVWFEPYTPEEMVSILSRTVPSRKKTLVQQLSSMVVQIFYPLRNNLLELKKIVHLVYLMYEEATKKLGNDETKTFKYIQPLVQKILKMYSDMISLGTCENLSTIRLDHIPSTAKYLMIASYLASYSNEKSDIILFGKGRVRKRSRSHALKSPGSFSVQRLFWIFDHIVDEHLRTTCRLNVENQILILVKKGYLSRIGVDIDKPRFKCLMTRDQVEEIARTMDMDLQWYISRD